VRVANVGRPILGLIPSLRQSSVDLLIVEITKDPTTGNEGVREVGRLPLERGKAVQFEPLGVPLEIEWADTLPPSAGQTIAPNGPCTICCVTCGQSTLCACLVEMDCGTCCCPAACACDDRIVSVRPNGTINTRGCDAGKLQASSVGKRGGL
jgi:hypothetical protein